LTFCIGESKLTMWQASPTPTFPRASKNPIHHWLKT
jgi:hypothetical protein